MNPVATHTIAFTFDAPADDADDLARSLAEWLNEDEELRGSARLRMVPPAPGEQGGLADAAEVLGAVGTMLQALIAGVAVWLGQRSRNRRIGLKVTRPDGTRVELTADSPQDAAALEEQLRRFLEPGSGDAS